MNCKTCGHPSSHHDAGQCWTSANGVETWDDREDNCPCAWYEPDCPELEEGR